MKGREEMTGNELVTPCYILHKQLLDDGLKLLRDSLEKYWNNYEIGYSFKTNSLPWVVAYMQENGISAEVVSKDEYLLAKKGVSKDFKEEWNWRRYMIEGKMFVAVCFDDNNKESLITLKLDPIEGDLLRQSYKDIIPGYYMNKVHWNSVKADGNVPDALMREMLEKSYRLVLGGFSKKKQRALLEGEKKDAI